MSGNLLYNSDIYRFPASCILMIGIVLIVFYFAFLKKKEYFKPDPKQVEEYHVNGLICKFKSIGTWRRYEFVHIFFWLLKDYCWCANDPIMWLAGVIPTLYISIDFVVTAAANKKLFVDMYALWLPLTYMRYVTNNTNNGEKLRTEEEGEVAAEPAVMVMNALHKEEEFLQV